MDDIVSHHEDNTRDPAQLAAELVRKKYPADIVEVLNELPPEEAAAVLAFLPFERVVEVFDEPDLNDPAGLILALPEEQARVVLGGLSADRATDIFRQFIGPVRAHLLGLLDPETKTSIEKLLTYPENTAGSIMTTEFVCVPSTWTIEQTLEHVRVVERTRETVYAIYVLDPLKKTLLQVVTLRRLISGDPKDSILSVARSAITTTPLTDREEVARIISKYDLLAVPVVDEKNHLIGIVTVDDIIDAIVEEGTEDVQKFGGMAAIDEPYMQISFGQMMYKRAGWLSILFMSEMLTASAMQYFENELEKAVVLTLFIPLIMSSGGNSGSQATSLLIRSLALRELKLGDWWRVAIRELPTGIALGAVLGFIGVIRITLWQKFGIFDYGEHWQLIAATVAAALVGIVTFGSMSGSMLPFILKRLGFDPASASAPFVATLVDVTGLVIYFTIALVFLKGTLL
ncbi:MAG TPA: magnesium transporter [Xanthobacteraceae bacterium]|nr:magnesium transporter [Xanthobacteraceae bacterium]